MSPQQGHEDGNPAAAMAEALLRSYVKGDDVSTCSLCHTRGHVTKDHKTKNAGKLCDLCWSGGCKEDGQIASCLDNNCPCQCSNRRSSI